MNSRLGAFGRVNGEARWFSTALGNARDLDEINAIDDAGRRWVAHDGGIVVLCGDGTTIVELPLGTVNGMTGSILHELGVVRQGPRRSRCRGRFRPHRSAEKPLAGLELQPCSVDCSSSPRGPAFRIVTDAKGRFQADNVPIVEYSGISPVGSDSETGVDIALEPPGSEVECCLQATPGKTLDLGTLEYHW